MLRHLQQLLFYYKLLLLRDDHSGDDKSAENAGSGELKTNQQRRWLQHWNATALRNKQRFNNRGKNCWMREPVARDEARPKSVTRTYVHAGGQREALYGWLRRSWFIWLHHTFEHITSPVLKFCPSSFLSWTLHTIYQPYTRRWVNLSPP